MKHNYLILLCLLYGVITLVSGCTSVVVNPRICPSPDGKKLAFFEGSATFMSLAGDNPCWTQASVRIEKPTNLRDFIPTDEIILIRGRRYWHVSCDLRWSPDSKRVACRAGRDLVILEQGSRRKLKLTNLASDETVSSFRWLGATQLVYVVRHSPKFKAKLAFRGSSRSDGVKVCRQSLGERTAKIVFEDRAARGEFLFRSVSMPSWEEISPDGKYFCYCSDSDIRCIDLDNGRTIMDFRINGLLEGMWIDQISKYCIIATSDIKSGERNDHIYLVSYTRKHVEEITEQLERLMGRTYISFTSRWFDEGQFFHLNNGPEDWIIRWNPLRALCVQEQNNIPFAHPYVAPAYSGSRVLLSDRMGARLAVAEVRTDHEGKPIFKTVKEIAKKQRRGFFWMPTGELVVYEGGLDKRPFKATIVNMPLDE